MYFDTHVCIFYNLYILQNAKIIVKMHIKPMKKIVESHKKMRKNDKITTVVTRPHIAIWTTRRW